MNLSTHTRWWGKGQALATPRLEDRSPTALQVQGQVRVVACRAALEAAVAIPLPRRWPVHSCSREETPFTPRATPLPRGRPVN